MISKRFLPLSQDSILSNLIQCILSAFLLVLSFPPTDYWVFAWFALVPFFNVLDQKRRGQAFGYGYFLGILFFAGTLYWFIHVTLAGAILLILYLAVYFGLAASGYMWVQRWKPITQMIVFPSFWVTLEYIRGHLLSGFSWVSLGLSQYKNLAFIQIADVTGMLGISFILVMGNVFLKEILDIRIKTGNWSMSQKIRFPAIVYLSLLVMIFGYGELRLRENTALPQVRVAVVQANIAQELKWNRNFWPFILEKYVSLTEEAALKKPDMIVWPETSFPGFLWEAPQLFEGLKEKVKQLNIPLLLGLVTKEGNNYYNSAVLISSQGHVVKRYDKLHLVPFGEYVPLRRFFPFFSNIVPIEDFTAGHEYTLFPIFSQSEPNQKDNYISVLICFEDTVEELSRGFVGQGSHALVNITNDAWFQDTNAPYLHLQASVFRTIENRRSLIRAANTGVSCFIDPLGNIYGYVENHVHKRTYVAGSSIYHVKLNSQRTFYTKYGDVFTYLCFGCILWMIIQQKKMRET